MIEPCMAGSSNILDYLIQKGAKINYHNESGYTALMGAAENGQINNVKVLIKYNADTKLKNKEGFTALDFAKQKNNKEIIDILEQTK